MAIAVQDPDKLFKIWHFPIFPMICTRGFPTPFNFVMLPWGSVLYATFRGRVGEACFLGSVLYETIK